MAGFFDSPVVSILSTIMHSVGVLGLMAALGGFLVWYNRFRRDLPRDRLRRQTEIVFWVSTVANIFGGTFRTVRPGHPSITEFAHSPWVQAMVWKHIFVVVCVLGLFYLVYRVMPWLERRREAGSKTNGVPLPQSVTVTLVVLGLVGASVLGAFAQAAPLEEEVENTTNENMLPEPTPRTVYHNASGTLTSIAPLAQDTAAGTFQIEPETLQLRAALTWSDANSELTLRLLSPMGDAVEGLAQGTATKVALVESPMPGTWTYEVSSAAAANVGWTLTARASETAGNDLLLSDTLTIAGASFFEINTEMPLNGTFCWEWTTDADVAFDVHSHFDDEVQYHVEDVATSGNSCFTNAREGGYSLLWAPEGNTPVQLQYRVWGEFTLHSYSP